MTTLPIAGFYSDNSRTEGEGKQVVEDILARLREQPGYELESELTIAAGTVTPTRGVHSIDTELDAAADDLSNIAQTNHPDGSLLLIHEVDPGRVVTVKHAASGAGQILLHGAADFVLDDPKKWLLLKRTGSDWEEISRSFGDDKAAAIASLNLYPSGQCRLGLEAPNLVLRPFNGNKLIIAGLARAVPDAGVSLAPTGLVVGTTYYIYAAWVAGAMVLETSTIGHTRDVTTGMEVKNTDTTRTLVGLARTLTGPAWGDNPTERFVFSWFNRIVRAATVSSQQSSSSTTLIDLPNFKLQVVSGASTALWQLIAGRVSNNTAGGLTQTSAGIDSVAFGTRSDERSDVANATHSPAVAFPHSPVEGHHAYNVMGSVDVGTGTWILQNTVIYLG